MRLLILFILSVKLCYSQVHEINGPTPNHTKPVNVDSVVQLIIGDWYLSGTSYYESEYSEGNEVYISAQELFHTRITKDSIFFIPPSERFYVRPVEDYKYTFAYDELMDRLELTAYHEHKKKKSDFKYFVVEYSNGELRLKEALCTNGFEFQCISACSKYYPTYDSTHLEENLLGTWQSSYEFENAEFNPNDTIVFYDDDGRMNHFGGIHLTFEIKKGIFSGTMERSITISDNETSNSFDGVIEGGIYGIVDGVYLRDVINCLVDPIARTITFENEHEKYVFSVLSNSEKEITLMVLEKAEISPNPLDYRR